MWLVRPQPLEDELLSSWLHRLARANHLADHSFCRCMFGSRAVWNRDIDRSADEALISALSEWTGVSVDRIYRMTLTSLSGLLSPMVNAHGLATWILPIGVYHRLRRHAGQQFCPQCLSENPTFFRKRWRLAFVVTCVRHGIAMYDRCPRCQSAVMLHRMSGPLGAVECTRCSFDLRRSPSRALIDRPTLRCQNRLEQALADGWVTVRDLTIPSIAFFDGLRRIAKVTFGIRRPGLVQAYRALDRTDHWSRPTTLRWFEHYSLAERTTALAVLGRILDGWPHELRRASERARVIRCRFNSDSDTPPPFWLQEALDQIPTPSSRWVSEQETIAAANHILATTGAVTSEAVARLLGIAPCGAARPLLLRVVRAVTNENAAARLAVIDASDAPSP